MAGIGAFTYQQVRSAFGPESFTTTATEFVRWWTVNEAVIGGLQSSFGAGTSYLETGDASEALVQFSIAEQDSFSLVSSECPNAGFEDLLSGFTAELAGARRIVSAPGFHLEGAAQLRAFLAAHLGDAARLDTASDQDLLPGAPGLDLIDPSG